MENTFTVKVGKEGKEYSVSKKFLLMSNTLSNMISDIEDESFVIPLADCEPEIFDKVFDFCSHYQFNHPDTEDLRKTGLDEWSKNFTEPMDKQILFDVVLAANFLDIISLLNIGTYAIGERMKGKSDQDIRDLFGLEDDFTPEERLKLKEESSWYDPVN